MPGGRDFRLLVPAQWLAQGADGAAQAGFAAALILDPLGGSSAGRILMLFAVTLLPYSLVSPFLGVFVDRLDRRALMVATSLARVGLLVSLPLWERALPGDTALFVALLVLLGLGRLFLTTKSALLPGFVAERELVSANSISGGGGIVSSLAGGIVGVGLAGLIGSLGAVVCAGLLQVPAALVTRRIHVASPPATAREPVLAAIGRVARELVDGLRVIHSAHRARLALVAILVLRTVVMVVIIAGVLFIKQHYPGADERSGRLSVSALVLAAAGLGAFLAALAAPRLREHADEERLVLLGYAITGASTAVFGGSIGVATLVGLVLIGGFGGFLTKVAVDSLVQGSLPDRYRGRAFALYDILYNLGSVLAGAVVVATAGLAVNRLLIATGAVTLGAGVALAAAMRRAGNLTAKERDAG
ncbi:MFS transporter [soil metagenome]